jgi:multiple sugar transport system permease protein
LTVNILNTPLTFWIPSLLGVGLRSGLFILIFRQFYAGIPQDLENAAKMDGCNHSGTYMRVMLPIALPPLITTFLLSFVWHWNDYHLSLLYFQATNEPMAVRLYKFSRLGELVGGITFTDYRGVLDMAKLMSAACILFILPVLILYIFTQRYYLSVGAYAGIKG